MWELQGQEGPSFFQCIPSRDVVAQRALQVIPEKARGKHAVSPGSWG